VKQPTNKLFNRVEETSNLKLGSNLGNGACSVCYFYLSYFITGHAAPLDPEWSLAFFKFIEVVNSLTLYFYISLFITTSNRSIIY
jgi:hypothetical protein